MKRLVAYSALFIIAVLALLAALMAIFPYNPDGYIRAEGDKLARLADTRRPPSVVLLGGSTVAFGYDSPLIGQLTGRNVINAGLHASLGMKCILDEAAPLLRPGDVLAFVPEIDQFYDDLPYGELEFADWMVLSGFASARRLNARQWWAVATNMPVHLRRRIDYFLQSRAGTLPPSIYRRDSFNANGDMTAHWTDSTRRYEFRPGMTQMGDWNEGFFNYYLQTVDSLESRGVRVLIIPTPLAASTYAENREKFDYAISRINASRHPYALPFDAYIMADSMFYDTAYHLRRPGAQLLSRRLSELLK